MEEQDYVALAFPAADAYAQPGMTLRDWFAGQALAAGLYHVGEAFQYAAKCYAIADAMLAERDKKASS